jgi:hypothetical protein
VANTNVDFLLKNPPENLWKNAVKLLGKEYAEWINYPIDPQLNCQLVYPIPKIKDIPALFACIIHHLGLLFSYIFI